MDKLLLHPTTEHQLKALLQSKPHAVLISGAEGVGKQMIAEHFVAQLFGPNSTPRLLHISPQTSGVGIEEVRKIRDFLHRKTTGTASIRRIVLVSNAHAMTTEAQNALLKTLEEPPADTMIILTASDPTALKQTIRSRTQQLLVLPVSLVSAEEYFKQLGGYKQQSVPAAYYMSDGRVGLLKAILEGSAEHGLVTAIAQAKEILKMSTYQRLLQVDALAKEKELLALLLQGLERVVISGLRQAANTENEKSIRKFYNLSKLVQSTQDALSKNVNAKIVLTELFIQM